MGPCGGGTAFLRIINYHALVISWDQLCGDTSEDALALRTDSHT